MLSISELGKLYFKDSKLNISRLSGYMEGTEISFDCQENRNKLLATCMNNGSWSPDPYAYRCQKDDAASIIVLP